MNAIPKIQLKALKNKRIIINFLLRFFIAYFVLLGLYSLYLHSTQKTGDVFACDPITKEVAEHTMVLANVFGMNTYTVQHESEPSMKFYVGDDYNSRIVEGCNSISIIILFLTFIIAFSGPIKTTVIYGILGSVIIYIVNILRLILLAKLDYVFPEYEEQLHDLVFPGIIYGTTFILWVIWVKKFSHLKLDKK